MTCLLWVAPDDCLPPHGLDMEWDHDRVKVEELTRLFQEHGFDKNKPALIGYPLNGKIQLLSGTHRHEAAKRAGILLPITPWLRSNIEGSWGQLEAWKKVMADIPVATLELWTREDLEKAQSCL